MGNSFPGGGFESCLSVRNTSQRERWFYPHGGVRLSGCGVEKGGGTGEGGEEVGPRVGRGRRAHRKESRALPPRDPATSRWLRAPLSSASQASVPSRTCTFPT